ncbi:MAG: molecular chaperone TorD family protein [Gaiellales bacterium]
MADRDLLRAFAEALAYPHGPLVAEVAACQEQTAEVSLEAAAMLEPFRAFVETATLGELQEAYTRAFDLDTMSDLEPTCYPYVGHHLFDENPKRSAFILGLNERFRRYGFSPDGELPDHLVVILQFGVSCDDDELVDEILSDAVVPSLRGMVGHHPATGEPGTARERYQLVLRALLTVLEAQGYETDVMPMAGHRHSGWEH